jgi:hypothetical protein
MWFSSCERLLNGDAVRLAAVAKAHLHWRANSTMAQLVDAGPPVSFANFGNGFARFCEFCEGRSELNRFRIYPPVTLYPQVSAAIAGTMGSTTD